MADMTTKILSVELDASKAVNGIISLNDAIGKNTQQIKDNNAMIAANNKAMQESGADVMKLTAQNQKLAQSNVELEAKTKVLKDERRALQKETQNEIKLQTQAEGSLKSLRAELSNLTKQYDSLSKAERQNEATGGKLLQQINDVTTEIKAAEEESQRYFRNVGNYPEAMNSVKGALRAVQDEIVQLTLKYRALDDEAKTSDVGLQMKERISQLTEQAGQYRDAMDDVRQSIRGSASDTRALDTAIQAGQTLAATFGLAKNAAAALGITNDSLQQTMLKMQQAMQAVQALQVIQNALQQQSNLMKGIAIIQAKAKAAAEAIEARVATQAAGATMMQTAAMKAFNLVAKANPYVLLATAIASVIGLITSFTGATKDATDATEDSTDELNGQTSALNTNSGAATANISLKERLKKSEKEWSDAVTQNANNQLKKYTELQLKWLDVNKDQKTREQFQREYGEEVNRVAGKVLKLSEYENFFVRDTDKVVNAILARAAAEAGAQKYAEAILKKAENDRNGSRANGRFWTVASKGDEVDISELYKREISLSKSQREKLESVGLGDIKGGAVVELTAGQAELLTEAYEKEADAIKALDDAEIEYWKNFAANQNKAAAAAEAAANMGQKYTPPSAFSGGGGSVGRPKGSSGGGTSKNAQQQAKDDAKELKDLQDMLLDVVVDSYERRSKATEKYTKEWGELSKRAIEEKYAQDVEATIKGYEKDLAELKKSLEKKKITQSQYDDFYASFTTAYNDKMKGLRQQELLDLKAVDAEIAKYKADKDAKDKKAAEDALRKAKEDAERQVQTMLDSMPEGSQGEMEWRLRQLSMMMQQELSMWENNEQMKVAIQKKYEQESEDVQRKYAQAQMDIQREKYEAIGKMAGSLGQIISDFAGESKEAAVLSKTLALAEVMIAQAVAIANSIKAASMGSVTPWGLIANIATSVTAVVAAMAQAFKSLNSAKFATGGYISGAGTSTSDSIPVRVSNGESIMNANTTAMFGGLLSSLNQLGGGVPIQVQETAANVRGEDMLARAFARGVAMLPNPVVSVEDINRGQRQVEVMNERATL